VLRYQRHDQEYKFPFNLHLGNLEIPLGLSFTTLVLGFVAIANLFSKEYATRYGVGFTLVVFMVFTISERVNARNRSKQHLEKKPLEEFNLEHQPQVNTTALHARPGCILVAVRDYHNMEHLKTVLQKTNLRRHDIVVMTVRTISTGAGEYDLSDDQIFSDYERELFGHVVEMAEKEGKPVEWESLPEPRHAFSLEVIRPGRPSIFVNLGPHPPRLWPEDVDRLHELWLKLSENEDIGSKLHHRDIVGVALRRLARDLTQGEREQVIKDLGEELRRS